MAAMKMVVNILPVTGVLFITLTGIGLGPAAIKWLIEGEYPRTKDRWERVVDAAERYRWDEPGALARENPNHEWRAIHRLAGNLPAPNGSEPQAELAAYKRLADA